MTTPSIVIRPRATRDIDDQAAYIAQQSRAQARRYLGATAHTMQKVGGMPGLGSPFPLTNPRLQGLRAWPVDRFPNHVIYYLPTADGIEVIRVLHAAQDAQAILEAES